MRPLPTDRKSLAPLNRGLIVTTTLTALVVAAVAFIGLQNRNDEAWIRHSLAVRSNLLGVVGAVLDAETAQRGYLLTGRSLYLAPYTEGFDAVPQRLDQLSVLVSDNPQQSQELAQLRRLAIEKLMNCARRLRKMRPATMTQPCRS
jgi:CHASE3 domain sensor protein